MNYPNFLFDFDPAMVVLPAKNTDYFVRHLREIAIRNAPGSNSSSSDSDIPVRACDCKPPREECIFCWKINEIEAFEFQQPHRRWADNLSDIRFRDLDEHYSSRDRTFREETRRREMNVSLKAIEAEIQSLEVRLNTHVSDVSEIAEDVFTIARLLTVFTSSSHQSRLKQNRQPLLMEIENLEISRRAPIHTRQEPLRNGIMVQRNSALRPCYALQVSKPDVKSLIWFMKKFLVMFYMARIRESGEDIQSFQTWMASNFISNVRTFIPMSLPRQIEGRSIMGCNDASSSASPIIINNGLLPVIPGSAVSGNKNTVYSLIKRNLELKNNVTVIGVTNNPHENLSKPWGVACDQLGHIVVSDRLNHRIQIYGEDGSFIRMFGGLGQRVGQFHRPAGVAIDKDHRIIVADKDNHRIQIFTMDGLFLDAFGVEGEDYGQLMYPWGVAANSMCQIVVSDTYNNRIQLFSPKGVFLRSFGGVGKSDIFNIPRGVCFNSKNDVLVCDFHNHRVIKINPDFTSFEIIVRRADFIKPISKPQGIVADDEDNFVVIDSKKNQFQVRDNLGWFIRETEDYEDDHIFKMKKPAGVALTASKRIIIADSGRNRILIY